MKKHLLPRRLVECRPGQGDGHMIGTKILEGGKIDWILSTVCGDERGVYLGPSTGFGVKCLLDKFPRTYGIQTQRHWFVVGS